MNPIFITIPTEDVRSTSLRINWPLLTELDFFVVTFDSTNRPPLTGLKKYKSHSRRGRWKRFVRLENYWIFHEFFTIFLLPAGGSCVLLYRTHNRLTCGSDLSRK